MAMKRMVLEIGMGTDIRGRDYTKAAVRALRDALWHNSLTVAVRSASPTRCRSRSDRRAEARLVDQEAVLAVLPHGTGTVRWSRAGSRSRTRPAPAPP